MHSLPWLLLPALLSGSQVPVQWDNLRKCLGQADPERDSYSKLVKREKNQQTLTKPLGPEDAFGDAKAAGSQHCEAAVNQLRCQGNQSRVLMIGKKPNVLLSLFSFQKAEEEELQHVQPNLSPNKNMEQKLLQSISSTPKERG